MYSVTRPFLTVTVSKYLTANKEAAYRIRFHLCSDECHGRDLHGYFTMGQHLKKPHIIPDTFKQQQHPLIADKLLYIPGECGPGTEWSGFLELCPRQLDAKTHDCGPDTMSNLHTNATGK